MKTIRILAAAACAVPAFAFADDDSVTVNGISFYGKIDVGVTYDTHGAPPTNGGTLGSNYVIQKNSNKATWEMIQSGLAQSVIGLKGAEDIGNDWTGLFKLETAINPINGRITDAVGTIAANNGVAQNNQTSLSDSSLAGQLFGSAAYVGLTNPVWGTVTFGRQNSLQSDAITNYDPSGRANAFSLIGSSGNTAGAGRTEEARWDNSVKYLGSYGPVRAAVMYQFAGTLGRDDSGIGADLGFDYAGLSVDAVYTDKKDETASSALTAAQVKTATAAGYDLTKSISATVSDNMSWGLNAKYAWDKATFYAGYERIHFGNASSPLPTGFLSIGGYQAAVVSNTGAQGERLEVVWAGARYWATPKLEAVFGWNHYIQNNYHFDSCNNASFASCSGTEDVFGLFAEYHITKRFEAYGGAIYSLVVGGFANGFYHNNNIDPTVGVRYSF
ncbi:MAG TPA: porin [Magnetospirillaceae bacterium]|nr:porin [Magnetospirillaceae bacterium]